MLTGMRLTLPDDTVFRATGNLEMSHGIQYQYLVNGFENIAAIIEQWFDATGGQSDRGDSPMQSIFAGVGAGVHTITVDFSQWEGSTQTWGDSADGDSAISKLQELNHALTNARMDSNRPAELELGEYSDSGKFDGIPVVVSESTLVFNAETMSSEFDSSITFAEAADLSNPIDQLNLPP